MLAQGRVRTRVSSGSGVDRRLPLDNHDSFFKTARTKGRPGAGEVTVPSAFCPFAACRERLGSEG